MRGHEPPCPRCQGSLSFGETQWTRLQHAKKVETERGQIVEPSNRLPSRARADCRAYKSSAPHPRPESRTSPLCAGCKQGWLQLRVFSNGSSGVESVLVSAMESAAVHIMPTRPYGGSPQ